ncbi:MAG: hypothetical protein ACK5WI_04370, partial [Cyanobacteriota bacterium]
MVFLAQVITSLFPLALLQPQWMVRVSTALRGTASLPQLALERFKTLLDGPLRREQACFGLFPSL